MAIGLLRELYELEKKYHKTHTQLVINTKLSTIIFNVLLA